MKVSKKDLSLLLVLFAFLLVIGAIFYGNSLAGKTETLVAENATLSQEVAYLQDLYDHQQEYQEESDRMNYEMEEIKEKFPAEIRPETQIMYANGLEAKYDVLLDTIDMPGTELVTVQGDFSVAGTTTAMDTTAETEDVDGESTDTTETTDATQTVDTASTISTAATTISLLKSPTSLGYQSSYKGLKDLVRTINGDTDRKSIESLSVGYDETTGNLVGTLEMSMYALSGTDKEYQAPVVTGVTDGLQQIFTGATTLNRSGANLAGDAATADGKADNASGTTDSNE